MNNRNLHYKDERGIAVMIGVIFFLVISLGLMFAVANPISEQISASSNYVDSAQSYVTAEALNDDALYRLDKGLSLPTNLSLSLNNSTSTAVVTDFGDTKQILSQGHDGNLSRSVKSTYSVTTGLSFYYGLQTGTGGINLTGGAGIIGNVFSNGNITGTNGTYVTGSASVANASDPSLDQTNGTSSTPSTQIDFGGTMFSGDNKPDDVAQGFKVTSSVAPTSLRLFLKKNNSGWIQDITVRLVNDSGGVPGNTTLASGTITAGVIGTSYAYTAVAFSGAPSLTPGTQYWIVLDTPSTSWNNYYSWAATSGTYANGVDKGGAYGGSWTGVVPSGADGYFDLFLGGVTGLISGVTVGSSGGDARAHEIRNATINGTAYCQVSSGSTNKSCNTTQADPSQTAYPIVDSELSSWKDEATAGTNMSSWTLSSNNNASTTGPTKINGNLSIDGGATLTLNGTLYVTGNIYLNGGGKIQLGSSYGTKTGVIVVDGTVTMSGGASVTGNGNAGSYILIVSTNTSCATGISCGTYAINANGGAGSVVLVAQNGGIKFTGGAKAKSAVANYMDLEDGTTLQYETGLANINFSSGPAGTWSVNSWKEIAQ